MTILDRVKEMCVENGVPISQLEKDLGFSNKSIFSWKTSSPSIDKVKAVADYFGVTIDSIVSNKEDKVIDADTQAVLTLLEKCSPSEKQTAIRLIQALRGDN